MSRLINPWPQHDGPSSPYAFGKVYFGLPNEDPVANPKAPFSDSDLTIPLKEVQTLDNKGMYSTAIHLKGSYSMSLFDSDGNFIRTDPEVVGGLSTTDIVIPHKTLAALVADPNLNPLGGDAINLAERIETFGGGAMWDSVLTSDVTPNTFDVVVSTAIPDISFVLRIDHHVNCKAAGCIPDGSDSGPAFQNAIDIAIARLIPCFVPAGIYDLAQGLTFTGNDITFIGESMETVFMQFSSAVTGAMLDVNPGGATRRFRGYIGNIKLIGAQTGSFPDSAWASNTYYADSGIEVEDVVNGFMIDRVRVLKTNTNGIAFKGASNVSDTWFNTINECFSERCKGNAFLLEGNSNGVKLSGNRAFLCNVGYRISDSFAIEINGCGAEDTEAEGMILSAIGGFSISGSWFEDHGLVTATAGAIDINGVVGDATRPATGTISGCLFNSCGTYAIDATNTKLHISGCKALNDTTDGIVINADCEITEKSNLWDVTGVAFSGSGAVSGLVDAEGTWTPVISDATTAGNTATFDANATSQKYWKRGNMMTIQARLENIDTTGMTAGNILFIQGLPVAASALNYLTGTCELSEVTINGVQVVSTTVGSGSTTTFYLTNVKNAATRISTKVSDVTAATADIFVTMPYAL